VDAGSCGWVSAGSADGRFVRRCRAIDRPPLADCFTAGQPRLCGRIRCRQGVDLDPIRGYLCARPSATRNPGLSQSLKLTSFGVEQSGSTSRAQGHDAEPPVIWVVAYGSARGQQASSGAGPCDARRPRCVFTPCRRVYVECLQSTGRLSGPMGVEVPLKGAIICVGPHAAAR
jgi:hypothetical protein